MTTHVEWLERLDTEYTFSQESDGVPADIRPVWRIAILPLLIDKCWGRRASLEQLYVLNWAVRTPSGSDAFVQLLSGDLPSGRPVIRFEPALSRAIDLARGLGVVARDEHGRYVMTAAGEAYLEIVMSNDELFIAEKARIASIPTQISQARIQGLMEGREVL